MDRRPKLPPALDALFEEHERWLRSSGEEGAPLDVREHPNLMTELRGFELNNALCEVYLAGADLSDVDLYRCDLRDANLDGANLSGANLCKAELDGTSLVGCVLRGADLARASLVDADLRRADLTGVEFLKTCLFGADLRGAILATNLVGAWLDGARLGGAVIANATGIDEIRADWFDVGLESEERLQGDAMRAWFSNHRTSIDDA